MLDVHSTTWGIYCDNEYRFEEHPVCTLSFTSSRGHGIWWVPPGDSAFADSSESSQQANISLQHLNPPEPPCYYQEATLPPPLSPPPPRSSALPATPLSPMPVEQHADPTIPMALPTIAINSELNAAEAHKHAPAERVWFPPRAYWDARFAEAEEEARNQRRSSSRRPKSKKRAIQIGRPMIVTRSTRRRNQKLINLDGPVEIKASRTRSGCM